MPEEKTDAQYAPHQLRVIHENSELIPKVDKLKDFIGGALFATLADAEQERLKRQLTHMEGYAGVLTERINAF